MNGRLVDTNILIYLSKKELEFTKVARKGIKLYISVITYMEALGYPFKNNNEKQIIENLCSHIEVIHLNQAIIDTVIQLKQQKRIKLPDAIILASAIVSNIDLVTANESDFENISSDLHIINPLK